MTIAEIAEAPPLQSVGKFTDEMALDWLAANPNTSKTVRELAELWGWSKSRTQRFMSRFAERGTKSGTALGQVGQTILSHGTDVGQTILSHGTSGTSGTNGGTSSDFDFAQSEQILEPRTSVFAYIEPDTGDLRISASDALLQCDTEIRIARDDVEVFAHRLMALFEDWQKQR